MNNVHVFRYKTWFNAHVVFNSVLGLEGGNEMMRNFFGLNFGPTDSLGLSSPIGLVAY
jgi:hypothetical protein